GDAIRDGTVARAHRLRDAAIAVAGDAAVARRGPALFRGNRAANRLGGAPTGCAGLRAQPVDPFRTTRAPRAGRRAAAGARDAERGGPARADPRDSRDGAAPMTRLGPEQLVRRWPVATLGFETTASLEPL